tara:strand:+ start:207 stop:419 length:213 start_codon:yes stop_codon:yes gene_type:complete
MEQVYEQFFILKYHGGWSFVEAYNLPLLVRQWFVERLAKQFKKEAEEMEKMKKKTKTPRSSPRMPRPPRK